MLYPMKYILILCKICRAIGAGCNSCDRNGIRGQEACRLIAIWVLFLFPPRGANQGGFSLRRWWSNHKRRRSRLGLAGCVRILEGNVGMPRHARGAGLDLFEHKTGWFNLKGQC